LIHPFIIENDNIEKIGLTNCGFGQHDLQMLAAAFSQRRNPTSIKHLGIEGINIDDESVPILVEICGYCPRLQHLDLTYSHQTVGIQGWTHLATFLEDPRCSIKYLVLAEVNMMRGLEFLPTHSLVIRNSERWPLLTSLLLLPQ